MPIKKPLIRLKGIFWNPKRY